MILDANLTAATLLVLARIALVNRPISRFILEEDQDIYYLHFKKIFETGASQVCELRMLRPNGKSFWARLETTITLDNGGAPVCRTVVCDITERKREERTHRELEERLQRAEKMEALGTLAGGVAHDLNNILGILVGYSELLLDNIEESSHLRTHIMEISRGSERAAAIVQDMLTLARGGSKPGRWSI